MYKYVSISSPRQLQPIGIISIILGSNSLNVHIEIMIDVRWINNTRKCLHFILFLRVIFKIFYNSPTILDDILNINNIYIIILSILSFSKYCLVCISIIVKVVDGPGINWNLIPSRSWPERMPNMDITSTLAFSNYRSAITNTY